MTIEREESERAGTIPAPDRTGTGGDGRVATDRDRSTFMGDDGRDRPYRSGFSRNGTEYKSKAVSYLLWCSCFFGICGIHRFYNGRPISGLIWLLTGGLLFIGQIVDLFLIPGHVRQQNLEARIADADRRERFR